MQKCVLCFRWYKKKKHFMVVKWNTPKSTLNPNFDLFCIFSFFVNLFFLCGVIPCNIGVFLFVFGFFVFWFFCGFVCWLWPKVDEKPVLSVGTLHTLYVCTQNNNTTGFWRKKKWNFYNMSDSMSQKRQNQKWKNLFVSKTNKHKPPICTRYLTCFAYIIFCVYVIIFW